MPSEPRNGQSLDYLAGNVTLSLVANRAALLGNLRFVRGKEQVASANRRSLQSILRTKYGLELVGWRIAGVEGLALEQNDFLLSINASLI